ncbi:BrnA antitoxin family protein [uncultured Sphingomonas sp.]|uniref:BrnA antitoxin family protein n=1 Tax=uncultured Sphingomonas sp. TaxID=158754 RepID=UPI00259330DF|nr:BrnA antitoxin family protein [uncultured Sphingomonas sp.]
MNKPHPSAHFDPDADFDENPEWTEADFARARPAREVLPPHVAAMLTAAPQKVTLRLDRDVIAKFRATGPGWHARINAALRAAQL